MEPVAQLGGSGKMLGKALVAVQIDVAVARREPAVARRLPSDPQTQVDHTCMTPQHNNVAIHFTCAFRIMAWLSYGGPAPLLLPLLRPT